jgi:hypothetical protein
VYDDDSFNATGFISGAVIDRLPDVIRDDDEYRAALAICRAERETPLWVFDLIYETAKRKPNNLMALAHFCTGLERVVRELDLAHRCHPARNDYRMSYIMKCADLDPEWRQRTIRRDLAKRDAKTALTCYFGHECDEVEW